MPEPEKDFLDMTHEEIMNLRRPLTADEKRFINLFISEAESLLQLLKEEEANA